MSEAVLGVAVMGLLAAIAVVGTCVIAPVVGLSLASGALLIAAFVWFSISRGAMHEATAAILLVGAFLCAGFAGLVYALEDVRTVAGRLARKVRAEIAAEAKAAEAEADARQAAEQADRDRTWREHRAEAERLGVGAKRG